MGPVYADSIIARRIANYERHSGVRLREVDIPRCRDLVRYLEGRRDPRDRKKFIRPQITPEFRSFILNDLAMSKANFLYWARRYAFAQRAVGDGGFDLFVPWESQFLLIAKLAESEVRMWAARDAGHLSYNAICYFIHKARQLGFTLLCQLLLLHRAVFYGDTRQLTASLDDQKTQLAHKRWLAAYERLPWWMKPGFASQSFDRGHQLSNGSQSVLQDFAQKTGLGQGEQWDNFHMTELASVDDYICSTAIYNMLLPTLTSSMRGLGFMESTSQGMGNWWHRSTESARAGEFTAGVHTWGYCFIPWYAERTKNARYDIPVGWQPDADTLAHAGKVRLTSREWMGYDYELGMPQLYFYQMARETAKREGEYATFLVNFCATPEESFQHSGQSAFDSETIVMLTDRIYRKPLAYELGTVHLDRTLVDHTRNIRSIGSYDLVPVVMSPRDEFDPRGLVFVFDLPRRDILYSVGGDSCDGITGWRRSARTLTKEEKKKDNACTSIWMINPENGLTEQVAEFAAPVTPREFAIYMSVLGRMYAGVNGMDVGAPVILEIYPAAGGAETQAAMRYEHKYFNYYQWRIFNGMEVKMTEQWGWVSNHKSVRMVWSKAKELGEKRTEKDSSGADVYAFPMRPQSRYMLGELQYAKWDVALMRGYALSGDHDDRISASWNAIWQLHDWGSPHAPPVRQAATAELIGARRWPCDPRCRLVAAVYDPAEGHTRDCKNLPMRAWDWAERPDIVTGEDLTRAYEEWEDQATARYR